VKKKQFFRNFMTIMLFGAVGTLISFGIISIGNVQNAHYGFYDGVCFSFCTRYDGGSVLQRT